MLPEQRVENFWELVQSAISARDTRHKYSDWTLLSFQSEMATTNIFTLLAIFLMVLVCQGKNLDPDVLEGTATSKAALTRTQESTVNASKVTVLVTYHRNQEGHLVAQVKLCEVMGRRDSMGSHGLLTASMRNVIYSSRNWSARLMEYSLWLIFTNLLTNHLIRWSQKVTFSTDPCQWIFIRTSYLHIN
jgi:hypothetical protein